MPDNEIENLASASDLTLEQVRRVEALQVARRVLENKPGLFVGSKVESDRDVYDLTYLAVWVLGSDDTPEDPDDRTDPDDRSWYRRQGYVDGVKAAATFIAAGGSDVNELLGDDAMPPSNSDSLLTGWIGPASEVDEADVAGRTVLDGN